jgi:uncharacterized membrane protein
MSVTAILVLVWVLVVLQVDDLTGIIFAEWSMTFCFSTAG